MDTALPPRLIAFAGPAGIGKSEASDLLVSKGFQRVKFAYPLKQMLTTMYEIAGLDQDEITLRLEGNLKEKSDPVLRQATPRHAMQTLGGEWGRDSISPDFWVSLWRKAVSRKIAAGISVVTDDLRYPNEAEAIRELGGEIIMLKGYARRNPDAHPSERFDFDPDRYILNNSTLEVFWDRIYSACSL